MVKPWSLRDRYGQQWYSGRLWYLKCSVCTKGQRVCQENIPHTLTPRETVWTTYTRQVGAMLACCFNQILSSEYQRKNQDSSDQAKFIQSSAFQFWQTCAKCNLTFKLTGVVLCYCFLSASRLTMMCIQRPWL